MMDKYSDMSLVSVHTIFKDYVQGSSSKCVSHEGWGGGVQGHCPLVHFENVNFRKVISFI